MRGNKPKPAAIALLRASGARAAKLAKRQIKTPGPIGEPPEWLSAEQKAEWAYIIENAPRDVLRRIDKSALAAYVIAVDVHRMAVEEMGDLILVESRGGCKTAHPAMLIINRQAMLIARLGGDLGFTPCSRARIESSGGVSAERVSDWDEIASA